MKVNKLEKGKIYSDDYDLLLYVGKRGTYYAFEVLEEDNYNLIPSGKIELKTAIDVLRIYEV